MHVYAISAHKLTFIPTKNNAFGHGNDLHDTIGPNVIERSIILEHGFMCFTFYFVFKRHTNLEPR